MLALAPWTLHKDDEFSERFGDVLVWNSEEREASA